MTVIRSKVKEQNYIEKPDFLIRIHLTHNTSWQGEIQWLNKGQKVYFRSLLELIILIQNAIELSGSPRLENDLRSWEKSS